MKTLISTGTVESLVSASLKSGFETLPDLDRQKQVLDQ